MKIKMDKEDFEQIKEIIKICDAEKKCGPNCRMHFVCESLNVSPSVWNIEIIEDEEEIEEAEKLYAEAHEDDDMKEYERI